MGQSLIALPLPQAMALLETRSEALVGVIVTGPPGAGRGEGVPRVIRERRMEEGIQLTVAFPVASPRG